MNRTLTFFLFFAIPFQLIFAQKITINSNWQFHRGGIEKARNPDKWEPVNLPHTWNALDVLDDKPGIYTGECWYKKQLYLPGPMRQKQVYIYFEAANQDATVFLNDQRVGTHHGGYTAFCFNITKYLNKTGDNVLKVKLDNRFNPDVPPVGGDMERFGGIYRDVFLIAKNEVHFDISYFASSGVFITTSAISGKKAELLINAKVKNPYGQQVTVAHSIWSPGGIEVQQSSAASSASDLTDKVVLANPKLWSPTHPNLYTLQSQILDEKGRVLDEAIQEFGVRTLSSDKDKGILLNGEPIFIKGIGKHQDYDKTGYAVPNEILRTDVALVKEMGANLLRSHYPLDPVTYDRCDELGVMVWGKIPIMDKVTHTPEFMQNSKTMMQEVMYQNYNRPSFILWGFACEIFGDMDWYWPKPQHPEKVKKNLRKTESFSIEMEQFIREIDPYRLTANDFHTDPTPEFYKQAHQTHLQMVNGWNLYQGWYHNNLDSLDWALNTFRAYNPDVPFIIAEYGAGSDPRLHSYQPTIFDFTTEYQDIFHETYLNTVKEHNFVHGMCIWTLFDFQRDGRSDAVPNVNSKGLLRADRTTKGAYYLYQANWSRKPMVHIAAKDWNRRKEIVGGKTAARQIRVYSNQDEVELFLNGKSLGAKHPNNHIATWEVPFRNGTNRLQAVALNTGPYVSDDLDIEFEFVAEDLTASFPEDGICINVGQSRSYFLDELTKNIWMPDKGYQTGNFGHIDGDDYTHYPNMLAWEGIREGVDQNIKGTPNDPVFQTFLTGISAYKVDVPEGEYEVTLLFAEPFSKEQRKSDPINTGADSNGARIFDVSVNGATVFEHLDLSAQFGSSVAVKRAVYVKTKGGIQVRLHPIKGKPVLNGLKIKKL